MAQSIDSTPIASCAAVLSGRRELRSETSIVTVPGGRWSPEVTASASSHLQTAPQVLELPRKHCASTSDCSPKLVRDAGYFCKQSEMSNTALLLQGRLLQQHCCILATCARVKCEGACNVTCLIAEAALVAIAICPTGYRRGCFVWHSALTRGQPSSDDSRLGATCYLLPHWPR